MSFRFGRAWRWFVVLGLISASAAVGVEPSKARLKPGEFNPAHETVELFEAIQAKQIDVRVLPQDIRGGKVLITNKSGRPLNVKLPDAFAAVHVLAQIGGAGGGLGGGLGGGGGMGGGGGGQSMGGGMGGGGGGGAGGGNFFNVVPEKVGRVPYYSVCLEHGKPDPTSIMRYEMRPLDGVTTKREIAEVLQLLGGGQLSYNAAQALTWNINNGISFEELAAKRIEHLAAPSEPFFTLEEIRTAIAARRYLAEQAEARERSEPRRLPNL